MSKPGIIDPWRQDPPKPPAPVKGRIEEPTPDEGDPVERCVIYTGARAGLHVWVNAADDDGAATALARVKTLFQGLFQLKQQDVTNILKHYQVDAPGPLNPESASFALRRSLVASPQAAALIARHKVKAFVK